MSEDNFNKNLSKLEMGDMSLGDNIRSFSHYYKWMKDNYPDIDPYHGFYKHEYKMLKEGRWGIDICDATANYLVRG